MLYDIRLSLHYEYDAIVQGGRHQVRIVPVSIPGVQRVIAASLRFDPKPERETVFSDFFGNTVTTIVYRDAHDSLDIRLSARVHVEDIHPPADLSPRMEDLASDIARTWSLDPQSPHHFLSGSPRATLDDDITAYAQRSVENTKSVQAAVHDLCLRIGRDFDYDDEATDVETTPQEAFRLRRGVCQDFAHIMIAGLRGVGIPAGYVSGFLRTTPPPGKPRLEGADAMHAWVQAWCGLDVGWLEFDPTNAMMAGTDHISIGRGRDYGDISPIVGILRTSGSQEGKQSVDVVPLG